MSLGRTVPEPGFTAVLGIPEHELLRPIASGAYGEVWLARSRLGTLRAVKIVRRDRFERGEDFEREFRGLQRFEPVSRTHEALVDILQIGRQDEWFYYVMELADEARGATPKPEIRSSKADRKPKTEAETPGGQVRPSDLGLLSEFGPRSSDLYSPRTLRAELKSHISLPADEVIALGLKLAGALAHLHARGLVHRDVKPSNILFIDGEVKLADAGLVAAVDDARSLVGTPGYIPPEGPGTPQADLYSLGKVLYEAAFGKDRSDFPQLPPDLSARGDHSKLLELNEILLAACAKDPAKRYPSAESMLADLEFLQRGHSVRRKHTLGARWKLARQITLAAAGLALAGLGLVFMLREVRRTAPLSTNSYAKRLYTSAVYMLQRQTTKTAREAYANLTEAVRLDPRFTAAYYKLFEVYFDAWGENLPPYFDRAANMKNVASKLWKLNPNSAEFHTVNSWLKFDQWRFEEAIEEARRAIKLDPKFVRAHGFFAGSLLRVRGDSELARREFETAANLDGSDIIIQAWLGAPDYFERKFDRAIELYTRAHRQEDRAGGPLYGLARCFEAKGDFEKAIDNYEAAEASLPANVSARKAKYDQQRAALKSGSPRAFWETVLAQLRQSSSPDLYEMARVCARLNQTNEVFALLERAYQEHNGSMVDLLLDDCWDPLREHPRFKDLVRRMGFGRRDSERKGSNGSVGRQ
jgi:tetratricopeptide (TPR) repeat protein